ncbi:MAG: aminomethyl-transferring glycine dehydrogenase [Phycisphaerae bacterium]
MAEIGGAFELIQTKDEFVPRHIGPSADQRAAMLAALGYTSLDALIDDTVPANIRLKSPLRLDTPRGEFETLRELREIASHNQVFRSLIGMGYYDTITPSPIQRNILENPGWYTQYTPYQAEISQGRLEACLNFQTMVSDLTGLPLANASLLDEATAAAEAMHMCWAIGRNERMTFFVADDCHPQTIALMQTRAAPLGIELVIGKPSAIDFSRNYVGVLLQYPNTHGLIHDYADLAARAKAAGTLVVVATDLLACTLLKPPGEWGADVAIGSSQRFGVPLGFGGPHAAFMATRTEYARQLPGRLVGVSKDATGAPAYRLTIQTREQHIRREKATSNICTAQVLLAVMAGMYGVYHGPQGVRRIARRVQASTVVLADGLRQLGCEVAAGHFFDTLHITKSPDGAAKVIERARSARINLRDFGDGSLGISLDECTTPSEIATLLDIFVGKSSGLKIEDLAKLAKPGYVGGLSRTSAYMTHPVFNSYHAEHELLRYIKRLESRDLSLTTSMIPLGSCTMKLNAAAEMFPVSWPEFGKLHPFAPSEQTRGYATMFAQLEQWLAEITGFAAISLQPNSGAQGEYAGLLVIRAHHIARNEGHRNICLIPVSAHGTNPASAVMAGMEVVAIACDEKGNIDVTDLKAKAAEHANNLAALMITYPSTHGVFEETVKEICACIHQHGGQVYMDGANLNAQVGLCRPGDIGADVCHLNLHKTFCIPHGGGGPGMGPIGVANHLAQFLPGHPVLNAECRMQIAEKKSGVIGSGSAFGLQPSAFGNSPVSAAPYGSASILTISWMYIRMMGGDGLTQATQTAILNANYMAKRLESHYPVVYTGKTGRVAHEFIIDLREFNKTAGISAEDVAKRLMDYGFHAPTQSWPVANTLMIEPTESESRAELDRLCDALISIRAEIAAIEQGKADKANNPLKHAPHTAAVVTAEQWTRPYSREQAAFPAPWVRTHKFWPHVARIDNVYGDRNLFCTCVPMQ